MDSDNVNILMMHSIKLKEFAEDSFEFYDNV